MKAGTCADRHRNVVLDRAALRLLRVGHRLAQAPERLALLERRGERRVGDQLALERVAEQRGQRVVEAVFLLGADFDQRVPRMRVAERIARARIVGEHEFHADARHDLEAGDLLAEAQRARSSTAPARAPGRRGRRTRWRGARGRANSFSDAAVMIAERAFGADEQVLEVVAGVVLAQLGEEIGDAPVGQHHLDAERQVARVAVGDAPRRRRRWTTDCRRSCRFLRKPATAGTAGRPPPPPPAPRRASRRLRRSSRRRRRRLRGCG